MRFCTPVWGMGAVCAVALSAPVVEASTIAVPAGGDLQAAINVAADGDVITLVPGATYVGNFVLTNKAGVTHHITIRSAAPDAQLPPDGVRMTPTYAAFLPKIKSPNSSSAMRTATAAHHWKLMFLEFQANLNGYGDVVALGAGDSTQTTAAQVPYELIIDRVYVHGDPVMGQKRGVSLNSSNTTIVNSYISECKAVGQDSQALAGWNGLGNFRIENNYLEGATENFLMGGADPTIPNLVPANITFRRNYLTKPLAWRDPIVPAVTTVSATAAVTGGTLQPGTYYYKVVARTPAGQTTKALSQPSAEAIATVVTATGAVTVNWIPVSGATDYVVYGRTAGTENVYWITSSPYFTDTGSAGTSGTPSTSPTKWAVKNVFELKNAQDVLVEGNVIENLWVAAQPGFPVVFTPRNQGGASPWTVVQRVTFVHNIVRHTAGGVNILGTDNVNPSQLTNHITIQDNIFDDITSATWGAGARVLQIGDGGDSITFDHNTIITTTACVFWLYGGTATAPTPVTNVVYTNNMSVHNSYGIDGSNFSPGTSSIAAYLPSPVVRRNVIAGAAASRYPADNFYPTVSAWQAAFVNYSGHDYHLIAGGPYSGVAIDGTDLGANIDWVTGETANATSGDNRLRPGETTLQITTTSLPDGQYQASYAQTLTCTGGTSQCEWELASGSLPDGLSLDPASGSIWGKPTAVQTTSVTVKAYDSGNQANCTSRPFTLTIQPPGFVVSIATPPSAVVGTPFQVAATASGAMGTAIWSIASGSLPPGVGLGPDGVISGTPTAWGTYTALVQAQDSWNASRVASQPVTVGVAPAPIAIATTTLAPGTYGTMYQSVLSATGGTGSTTWSVTAGSLPSGLLVDPSGVVSGLPGNVGTFSVTIQAADVNWPSNVDSRTLSLTIAAPPFSVVISPAPAAMVGGVLQMAATATGQVGTVTWSVVSGALPSGIGINAGSGIISGTPTMWGTFSAVVRGTDSWSASRTATANVTIAVAPLPLTIPPAPLGDGNVRIAYKATLGAAGGTGVTSWSVASGALPSGLTLAPNGAITGTPTSAGTFTFTAQATDTGWPYTATQSFCIKVGAREVILYASDATVVAGKWSLVADASAAGGYRIWNPDLGVAKITTPLANPANYFEVTFQAEAGVPYHFWLRGVADKNLWSNDSVMIQFSDSVDANGAPMYRIGTTTGGDVNLEDCSGCGVSGWGWQDNGWGANVFGPNIYFAQTGIHTLRVQVKEDGLSIDEIVLSGGKYLTASPGALKNDTTILSR